MSQKTDNLIKLALVFFVSLLSFSIGTYVGKKYSDNQHKLALLEPQKEASAKGHEEFATESSAAEGEIINELPGDNLSELKVGNEEKPAALTDSEVAKIAEEFASEEEATEEKIVGTIPEQPKVNGQYIPSKVVSVAPPVKKVEMPQMTEEEPVEKTVAKQVTSTGLPPKIIAKATRPVVPLTETITPTPVDENRVPASIPPTTEMVPIHYTVQIASFPTQSEAENLTKNLQNKGYKTSFIPAKVNGQTWYRVNVGLFGTIKEAQDYKKEFLEKTKLSSAIVQRLQR
jgi:cell division protein FtsN